MRRSFHAFNSKNERVTWKEKINQYFIDGDKNFFLSISAYMITSFKNSYKRTQYVVEIFFKTMNAKILRTTKSCFLTMKFPGPRKITIYNSKKTHYLKFVRITNMARHKILPKIRGPVDSHTLSGYNEWWWCANTIFSFAANLSLIGNYLWGGISACSSF